MAANFSFGVRRSRATADRYHHCARTINFSSLKPAHLAGPSPRSPAMSLLLFIPILSRYRLKWLQILALKRCVDRLQPRSADGLKLARGLIHFFLESGRTLDLRLG